MLLLFFSFPSLFLYTPSFFFIIQKKKLFINPFFTLKNTHLIYTAYYSHSYFFLPDQTSSFMHIPPPFIIIIFVCKYPSPLPTLKNSFFLSIFFFVLCTKI
ncbi:hypothetical protein BDA99DRAFT_200722 [Phascolomyces articulosus]|uniref:Uncharacterized protein n=1 Tax=Phascolomyces articulosus TaxID=60185 RepID=A0AAD5P9M1_9FUNG|nr:hypothetical protein BDA99DRAFT_200722 [Phascolomyces articulosus]